LLQHVERDLVKAVSFKCYDEVPVVTPYITKILIKLLKMQLSLKAREYQAVEDANQDLNYQDFKFEVSKCCLVWTDILNQQIFRTDRSRIRPYSQKRSCFP
jgi:hypothetical protein